jgi:hypothetical protein
MTAKQEEKQVTCTLKDLISKLNISLYTPKKQCLSFRYISKWDGFKVNIKGTCMTFFGAPTGTSTAPSVHDI